MSASNKRSGQWLIATGILHNAVGVGMGFDILKKIAWSGFFNAVDPHFDRMAIFWFLFSGFAIMMWGQLLLSMTTIPRGFAWSLLALSLVGVVMMPASGFWLVLPQALWMLRQGAEPPQLPHREGSV